MMGHHSMYKSKDKIAKATELQKSQSVAERRRRLAKIGECRNYISIRVYKTRIDSYCETLRILKEKYPKIYKEILSEVPRLKTTKQMKLEFYKSQYKEDGTSPIRGWIKKQIDKLEKKHDANCTLNEQENKDAN